jgi:hypothetical protein
MVLCPQMYLKMKSALILICLPLLGITQNSFFDHIQENGVHKIELISDFNQLKQSKSQPIKVDAYAIFSNEQGVFLGRSVGLEPRGKFRRRVCDFPPLKFRFDKKDLTNSSFLPFNEWKVVTHCTDNLKEARVYLRKEQLAYQLLSSLDALFFETIWVEMSYRNIQPPAKPIQAPAFIIEDKEELAFRNKLDLCNCPGSNWDDFDKTNLVVVSLFQFLIGNADWDLTMLRNVEILIDPHGKKKLAPYDFDYSGFVNPSYGLPNRDFQLKDVKDRVYLGPDLNEEELKTFLTYFTQTWENWKSLIYATPQLTKTDKAEIIDYLSKGIDFLRTQKNLAHRAVLYESIQ